VVAAAVYDVLLVSFGFSVNSSDNRSDESQAGAMPPSFVNETRGPFFVAYQNLKGVAVSCLFFTLDQSALGILVT